MKDYCRQCGMTLNDSAEYHPYPACLMYRQVPRANSVRLHLSQVLEWGRELERLGLPNDANIRDVILAKQALEKANP